MTGCLAILSGYPIRNAYNPYRISVIYIEQVVQRDDKQYIAGCLNIVHLDNFISLSLCVVQDQSVKLNIISIYQRCQSSGNFLISGNFSQMLQYKSIGKSAFSGNLQPFQDFLTTLTGISEHTVTRI